ncbi:hypothetical protein KFK09_028233 [Dendrobium nobile]|uniref:DDE Tnp4 domain-containing protein n=1 Tax=Dendrobium nobile TaxID=94219 RepID=A0A8T3A2T5_DENNO|nr:hypothetical protein KFK09_028233 [Dendrobium nobile]
MYFKAALHAVGKLHHEFIKPLLPETHIRLNQVIGSCHFSRLTNLYSIKISLLLRYLKNTLCQIQDCIGVIDGTHIKARVPKENEAAFRGMKPYPTQNVLATVYFDLRLTYVLAGWEGFAHDIIVLKNILERLDGLHVSVGKYYLADGGCSTRNGFIFSYRATRYHVKEFSSIQPTNSKELFNLHHSSLRTTIERAFGSLKNHFIIIKYEPYFPL